MISESVPTVELLLSLVLFFNEHTGVRPVMVSTSALGYFGRLPFMEYESNSKYFLCPSTNIVSNASDVFPDPETPVITFIQFLGISKLIFFKLFVLALIIFINLFP